MLAMFISDSLTVYVFCVVESVLQIHLGLEILKKDQTMTNLPTQSLCGTELRTGRTEKNVVTSLLWVGIVLSVFGTDEKQNQKTSEKSITLY